MNKINLFVYGTLQPMEYNFRVIADSVIGFLQDVTINGRVYFVSSGGGFPVAKLDQKGTIKGTLLTCDTDGVGYQRAYDMEEGAGYELRPVSVTVKQDGKDRNVPGFAWHFLPRPRGRWIESGDWSDAYYRLEKTNEFLRRNRGVR